MSTGCNEDKQALALKPSASRIQNAIEMFRRTYFPTEALFKTLRLARLQSRSVGSVFGQLLSRGSIKAIMKLLLVLDLGNLLVEPVDQEVSRRTAYGLRIHQEAAVLHEREHLVHVKLLFGHLVEI